MAITISTIKKIPKLTSDDYKDLKGIPTKLSEFTNDVNYCTETQLNNTVNSAVNTAINFIPTTLADLNTVTKKYKTLALLGL